MTEILLAATLWASSLKHRTAVPANFSPLTVEALLRARTQEAYPVGGAGRLTGWVTQRRREADGDWHLGIGSSPRGTRRTSVVCELTPQFQNRIRVPRLGDHIVVEGWLFWDGHHLHEPGRGTQWELHPITAIREVK